MIFFDNRHTSTQMQAGSSRKPGLNIKKLQRRNIEHFQAGLDLSAVQHYAHPLCKSNKSTFPSFRAFTSFLFYIRLINRLNQT